MKELVKLTDRVFYLPGFTNVGIVFGDDGIAIIDSGIDKSSAKAIVGKVKDKGRNFFVFNTHSHADHCGGNLHIKRRLGAKVYVPEVEDAFVEYPYLEPFSLFSGASPPRDLMIKFLMAEGVTVDYVIPAGRQRISVEDITIDVIPLGGHSVNHVGFLVDGVLFCGDAVFSEEIIEKYKVTFLVDVGKQLDTLKLLTGIDYNMCVPSHAQPTEDVSALVGANMDAIEGVIDVIFSVLGRGPLSTEQLVVSVAEACGMEITTISQYHLANTTVVAYLSYLYGTGRLKLEVKGNRPYWIVCNSAG